MTQLPIYHHRPRDFLPMRGIGFKSKQIYMQKSHRESGGRQRCPVATEGTEAPLITQARAPPHVVQIPSPPLPLVPTTMLPVLLLHIGDLAKVSACLLLSSSGLRCDLVCLHT